MSFVLPHLSRGPRDLTYAAIHIEHALRTWERWQMSDRKLIGPAILIGAVLVAGGGLALWKKSSIARADAVAASQPEPAETIAVAVAQQREHNRTTTSIGTVVALRSITVRNE